MAADPRRRTEPAKPAPELDVAVTRMPSGGWQITAMLDGRVLAAQWCDDWHRVERIRQLFALRLAPPPLPAT